MDYEKYYLRYIFLLLMLFQLACDIGRLMDQHVIKP